MSIHCGICGHQANWREDEHGNNYEVDVTDMTWVVLDIKRDPVLGEKTKRQNILERIWCHRDCVQNHFNELGCDIDIIPTGKTNIEGK